ncbi:hydroxymethylglutaryl-CoA lyase [Noviherbaspirillum saxi]|uniref:hydroxymethylglutaryl-CoA lyase n=1 Tax=Noviherbaspirillum saxi TaxID=2320863 RepID=A0A3A3FG97_9BURK|nr:hydroxymethylglutaryl-CoA lyase [Noviherbaspirillum saxi]RJF92406.1 hydroxymethylglutaryl-CoA lyase [Noviherbaspirillum saxi]
MSDFATKPFVKLVEVGPRDGLQNEKVTVPTETKRRLVEMLGEAGLNAIEVTAFVSPDRVPQMADNAALMTSIQRRPGVAYPVLVPNLRGLEAALAAGVTEIAVFGSASESFSHKNINCSISESLARFEPVMRAAEQAHVKVRGYVSCVLGCPYEGIVAPDKVATVARNLYELGCYEISLGDTIGIGTPRGTHQLFDAVAKYVPRDRLAGHFHDTYGQALVNIYAALCEGIRTFDSSVAGLGGCPYAPGASGNVATEDVIYLLHGVGMETGIDLGKVIDAGLFISTAIGRKPASKLGLARLAKANCA